VELIEAGALARRLLDDHGLGDWQLVFDGAKTRAGICRYEARQIGLSRPLTALHSEAQVTDTVLHEVAHALAGPAVGHGPAWKELAVRIGCSAARCVPEEAPRVDAPWVGTCPAGHTVSRHRRPARVLACKQCSPRFSPDAVFEWRWRGRVVPMSPTYAAELARLPPGSGVTVAAPRSSPPSHPGPTAAQPGVPVGARVRLGGRGRYAGLVGTVEKRGRTRYHVRTRAGLVAAPFRLVQQL